MNVQQVAQNMPSEIKKEVEIEAQKESLSLNSFLEKKLVSELTDQVLKSIVGKNVEQQVNYF